MGYEKKFVRDMSNNMIGGVCSGLAKYIDTDVVLIRILLVFLTVLVPPLSIILYALVWIVSPNSDDDDFNKDCFV